MPLLHHAAWVLPIAGPPIRDGWVAVERGKILDLGRGQAPGAGEQDTASPCVILPALVNAHAHLELSWMRHEVAPAASMPEWVERLMARRRAAGPDDPEPIAQAILEMRASGTAAVGDITNSLASWEALADSPLSGVVFLELLGFNVPEPRKLVSDAAARLADLTPLAWLR